MTFEELAVRCEGAARPDREVDCLIWCADNDLEPTWGGEKGQVLYAGIEGAIGWIDPGKHQRNFTTNRSKSGPAAIPAYTESLDAAITLVPEGWRTAMVSELEHNNCWLWRLGAKHGTARWGKAGMDGVGAGPALALTAAALKARAAQAIEARRAETPLGGSVHESAVGAADAP